MPGASYIVSITRETNALDASIHALVCIDQPLKQTDNPHADMNMLTTAIRKTGNHTLYMLESSESHSVMTCIDFL